MRRFLLGLMAVCLMACSPQAIPTDYTHLAKQATLELSAKDDDGVWRATCSAVALEDGQGNHTVMTATHCVDDGLPILVGPQRVPATIVAQDKGDTTLLHTKVSWPFAVKLTRRVPQDGEEATKYGFPVWLPKLHRTLTLATNNWKVDGHSGGLRIMNQRAYLWNGNVGPGDSGGAIFSQKAEVFCVYSFTRAFPPFGFSIHACVPPSFTDKQAGHLYGP